MSGELKKAVETLCNALREDKTEGSYYYSWQANIAMAFQDEWDEWVSSVGKSRAPSYMHQISNYAAKRFLDLLCHVPNKEQTLEVSDTTKVD